MLNFFFLEIDVCIPPVIKFPALNAPVNACVYVAGITNTGKNISLTKVTGIGNSLISFVIIIHYMEWNMHAKKLSDYIYNASVSWHIKCIIKNRGVV